MQRSLQLRGLLHALLHYSWLIAFGALLAGLGTRIYMQRLPSQYRSSAVIEIQANNDRAVELRQGEDELKDPEAIETIIANFRHRSLMERVSKALDLANDRAFLGADTHGPITQEAITDRLLSSSSASRRPNTLLIDVTYIHPDPEVARKVTNALVDQFVAQRKEERLSVLKEQNDSLKVKYEELKKKLEGSEQALQDYKRDKLNGDSLESVSAEDRQNYVEEKLRNLNASLFTASSERRGMESDRQLITAAGDDPKKLLAIGTVAQDPQVVAAQRELSAAQIDLSGMMERYGDKHPKMIEQRALVESARSALAQAARTAPAHLDSRYQAAVAREKELQASVATQEQAMLNLEKLLIPYKELARVAESDKALAESVLQKLKESTLALGSGDPSEKSTDDLGNFHVVEPAVAAESLANRRLYIVLGATFAGALLVASVIAALYFLDSSIRTVDTAERLLHLPVLATIPIMTDSGEDSSLLPLVKNPNSPAAESFRTLRCALSLLPPKDGGRVFLFTSAVPGEGKSLSAVNAAIAFAQQNLPTILVEADLRRPSIASKLLNMGEKLPGLGDCMAGKMAGQAPVVATPIPNLVLLTAGAHVPNPAELLASPRFEQLLLWMKNNFDRVVIDTAPVNVVSDTLSIVSYASAICLVVRGGSTSLKVIQRAIELLRRSGAKPDGLVLNYMPNWKGINNHYDYSSTSMYGNSETYGDSYAENIQSVGASAAAAPESADKTQGR